MRNTKSAFTLVELIVVITILAILGTIAFISLQGYSAEARNAKRTTDLKSINSALSVKVTDGMPILSAVNGDDANKDTTISLGGSGSITTSGNEDIYNAGSVNYVALELKADEFKDPNDNAYRIGATILAGGVYELASDFESDGKRIALVNGTYNKRTTATASGTSTPTVGTNKIRIESEDIGKFKTKDIVDLATTKDAVIESISRDGQTITLSKNVVSGDTSIQLNTNESDGLIFGTEEGENTKDAVENKGTFLPY